ncbi:uncharacterized protein LOC110978003 [Acanthaster planci]|uniref:Uncharacterized protein LOC110978003 n=1 Tax=Acanthaster planci TaxID=133434 RepID=A0A8B7Y9B9_ACAPL|nr:uncharacterized protein LOC110978003 [Acanthaster planci]
MDVRKGHCWRCEKPLPQKPLKCHGCPLAEYCSTPCKQQDKVRHGSVECEVFGPKRCTHCRKMGQTKECAGCNNAWYCNTKCQRDDWATHTMCRKTKKSLKEMAQFSRKCYAEIWKPEWRNGEPPVYIGNTIANDFLRLEGNEWSGLAEVGEEELYRDYHVLSVGCGDLRNTVLTVASLPARYQGKLHITLDDLDPFVMARNVMFLFMMVRYADRDGIASSLATIWYSVHISSDHYELIRKALQDLLQIRADNMPDRTAGLVRVWDADWSHLREVWEGWLALPCQRKASNSINLHQQRWDTFGANFFEIGFPQYLIRMPDKDLRFMREWIKHGLFLSKDMHQSRLTFDNPTLTGRPPVKNVFAETRQKLKTPKEYSFVYSVRNDQTPFNVWDCLRVDEQTGQQGLSVMVRYHAYVTQLLQKTIQFINQQRLIIHVFVANCLDFPNYHLTLRMPKYDRIFTSNLADYLGHCRLLKTFVPLLNSNNKHSTIVTQTMNWIARLMRKADILNQSPKDSAKYQQMCQQDTGFSPELSMSENNHVEYYNNMPWFLAYLRTDIMAGGVGIPVMDHAPKLSEVMQFEGLRMRDFRKELNRLVPFLYRINARKVTLLNGHERNVEWCLPDPTQEDC